MTNEWSARRILREICTPADKVAILQTFWIHGDRMSQRVAEAHLARSLRFREGSIRKFGPAKKAELLGSRLAVAEYDEFFEAALLTFHLRERADLMGAFLDAWQIRHDNGAIADDEYTVPTLDQVRESAVSIAERFPREQVMLYLATAGLIMGEGLPEWRNVTWPLIDEWVQAERSNP